jgi:hypothetical protein
VEAVNAIVARLQPLRCASVEEVILAHVGGADV